MKSTAKRGIVGNFGRLLVIIGDRWRSKQVVSKSGVRTTFLGRPPNRKLPANEYLLQGFARLLFDLMYDFKKDILME